MRAQFPARAAAARAPDRNAKKAGTVCACFGSLAHERRRACCRQAEASAGTLASCCAQDTVPAPLRRSDTAAPQRLPGPEGVGRAAALRGVGQADGEGRRTAARAAAVGAGNGAAPSGGRSVDDWPRTARARGGTNEDFCRLVSTGWGLADDHAPGRGCLRELWGCMCDRHGAASEGPDHGGEGSHSARSRATRHAAGWHSPARPGGAEGRGAAPAGLASATRQPRPLGWPASLPAGTVLSVVVGLARNGFPASTGGEEVRSWDECGALRAHLAEPQLRSNHQSTRRLLAEQPMAAPAGGSPDRYVEMLMTPRRRLPDVGARLSFPTRAANSPNDVVGEALGSGWEPHIGAQPVWCTEGNRGARSRTGWRQACDCWRRDARWP